MTLTAWALVVLVFLGGWTVAVLPWRPRRDRGASTAAQRERTVSARLYPTEARTVRRLAGGQR